MTRIEKIEHENSIEVLIYKNGICYGRMYLKHYNDFESMEEAKKNHEEAINHAMMHTFK